MALWVHAITTADTASEVDNLIRARSVLADVHRREFRQLWAQLITRAYTPPPAKPRRRSSIVRTEGALAGGVGIASLLAAWDPSEQEQLRGLVTAVRSHNTTASRRRNEVNIVRARASLLSGTSRGQRQRYVGERTQDAGSPSQVPSAPVAGCPVSIEGGSSQSRATLR